jgi:hypothetical protein
VVLLVLVSEPLLGTGSEGVSFLTAAVGVGGLAAAGLTSRLAETRRPGRTLLLVLLAFSLPLISLAVIRRPALAIEASRVFRNLGRALFQAVGLAAAGDRDLASALDDLAGRAPGPDAELAELAGAFARLGQAGPAERAAATRLVRDFLAYATGDGRWP